MEAGHVMRHPGGPEPLKDAGILERKVRDGKATKGWNSLDLTLLYDIFRFHAYALPGVAASHLMPFPSTFATSAQKPVNHPRPVQILSPRWCLGLFTVIFWQIPILFLNSTISYFYNEFNHKQHHIMRELTIQPLLLELGNKVVAPSEKIP